MFRAGATGKDQLLLEGLAGAVKPYCCVSRSDTGVIGEGVQGDLRQVNFADDLAVGRLHGGEGGIDAGADGLLGGSVRL